MAVLSKEELMAQVKEMVGDRQDDGAIKFLEDVTDTVNSFQKPDGEDWKAKYEKNDAEWRQKYKERFFSPEPIPDAQGRTVDPSIEGGDPGEGSPETYEDLFKEEVK